MELRCAHRRSLTRPLFNEALSASEQSRGRLHARAVLACYVLLMGEAPVDELELAMRRARLAREEHVLELQIAVGDTCRPGANRVGGAAALAILSLG